LSREQTADLVAAILRNNRLPAGQADLPFQAARRRCPTPQGAGDHQGGRSRRRPDVCGSFTGAAAMSFFRL